MRIVLGVVLLLNAFSASGSGETIQIQDLLLTVPDSWTLSQKAEDNQTIIVGLKKAEDSFTLFVKNREPIDLKAIFAHEASIIQEGQFLGNNLHWSILQSTKTTAGRSYFVYSFQATLNGFQYYGFSRSGSREMAVEIAEQFLSSLN